MIIVLVGWCARLPLENLANSPNSSEGGGRDFLLPPKNATHSEPPPLSPPQAPNILGYFRKTKKSLWGGSLWTNRSTSLVSNDFTKQVYKSWCCYSHDIILRYGKLTSDISFSEYRMLFGRCFHVRRGWVKTTSVHFSVFITAATSTLNVMRSSVKSFAMNRNSFLGSIMRHT